MREETKGQKPLLAVSLSSFYLSYKRAVAVYLVMIHILRRMLYLFLFCYRKMESRTKSTSGDHGRQGHGRGLAVDTGEAQISAVNPMMQSSMRSASSGSRNDRSPPSPSGASLRNVGVGRGNPRNRPGGRAPLTSPPLNQVPSTGVSERSVTSQSKTESSDATSTSSSHTNGGSGFQSFRNVLLDSGMAPQSP